MEHPKTRNLTLSKRKRVATVGLLMLIGGLMGLITTAQPDPLTVQVERVIDGDTLQFRHDGRMHTVRLIGVDTPETKHPTKEVQYFGREASAFTKAALEGRSVVLHVDRIGDTRDRYGRLLRYVYLNGEDFNARLVRQGYAHAIRRFRYTKKKQYIALEKQARARRRGLWGRR